MPSPSGFQQAESSYKPSNHCEWKAAAVDRCHLSRALAVSSLDLLLLILRFIITKPLAKHRSQGVTELVQQQVCLQRDNYSLNMRTFLPSCLHGAFVPQFIFFQHSSWENSKLGVIPHLLEKLPSPAGRYNQYLNCILYYVSPFIFLPRQDK